MYTSIKFYLWKTGNVQQTLSTNDPVHDIYRMTMELTESMKKSNQNTTKKKFHEKKIKKKN